MQLPEDVYKQAVLKESLAISYGQRNGFVILNVVDPPESDSGETLPIHVTNVHLIPGEASPRLRKAELLTTEFPGTMGSMAQEIVRMCLDDISATTPPTANHLMRQVAGDVIAAAEEWEKRESGLLNVHFRTVSMMAIAITRNGPAAYGYCSRSFVEVLGEQLPDTVDDETPEEVWRQKYMLYQEHRKDVPDYETWKEQTQHDMQANLAEYGGVRSVVALGIMHRLMVPEDVTHPVLTAELFR